MDFENQRNAFKFQLTIKQTVRHKVRLRTGLPINQNRFVSSLSVLSKSRYLVVTLESSWLSDSPATKHTLGGKIGVWVRLSRVLGIFFGLFWGANN